MDTIESLIKDLPDPEGAQRFYAEFRAKHPPQIKKLKKNQGLLSDILTLASYSSLLATTILQNPTYIAWLERERISTAVKAKEELLESLARFALTNSQIETNVMLARFRRRELIRIYLKDIRRLGTITEITEEISNLADAVLEYALGIARQDLDNRFGIPLQKDDNDRTAQAQFCVVALGKLGSKELNYSSDIDVLFLFSENGTTSGGGSRGKCSNKQYFIKLSELTTNLVGGLTGEGAAYRVDVRLRPHGRVGPLAISEKEAVRYYSESAQMWEKQVLIRSRAAAGDDQVFHRFYKKTAAQVFAAHSTVEEALRNVRRSKEKIDAEKFARNGYDVKLGKGGIREIEFIAQALQLAYGGNDPWLRAGHTLISLSRLADRRLISEPELTGLFDAYDFLRRLEHNVQMEHGLQTHFIPDDSEKRLLIAQRMGIRTVAEFDRQLLAHAAAVTEVFSRVFHEDYAIPGGDDATGSDLNQIARKPEPDINPILVSIEKSEHDQNLSGRQIETLKKFSEVARPFAEILAANPDLVSGLPQRSDEFTPKNYEIELNRAVDGEAVYSEKLAVLRKKWARFMIEIAAFDLFEKIDLDQVKTIQTSLAEASIKAAIGITQKVLGGEFQTALSPFTFGVLGLGKLGGGGMDYGSDLDLVLIYDDEKPCPAEGLTHSQYYSRAAEIFVTTLSSLTRDGSLYRVDLRLRPDGKNGAPAVGTGALCSYLESRAAVWEWLAYVKLRGIAGCSEIAESTEFECRKTVHQSASKYDKEELRNETWGIRKRLEKEKSGSAKGKEIDIKFGEGGLQDIYFAIRYLQLRDNLPDDPENRSSQNSLIMLLRNGSLNEEDFRNLSEGYKFLSALDHTLRLTAGRSTRVPLANGKLLEVISKRMRFDSIAELLETLTHHRITVRTSFENISGM